MMTSGSRATGPEPFHHKRGEHCRSGAARANRMNSYGYQARAAGVCQIAGLTPCGGLRVTPHASMMLAVPLAPMASSLFRFGHLFLSGITFRSARDAVPALDFAILLAELEARPLAPLVYLT